MDSPAYRRFTAQRNKELERILARTQAIASASTHAAVLRTKDLALSRYPKIKRYGIFSPEGKDQINLLSRDLANFYTYIVYAIAEAIKKQRRVSYMISYSSEVEAIGQALGKKTKYTQTKDKIQRAEQLDAFSGGRIEQRVQLAFNKLLRKVMQSIELSAVEDLDIDEMADRLERAFPRTKQFKSPRKILKNSQLEEADQSSRWDPDMSFGMIDEETWEEWVDVYQQQYIPRWRGPENEYEIRGDEDEENKVVYAWELEQEITQDFVYQVRLGQIEGAKENGIEDYIWIAIVDNRTDDCCLWRDGLTTKEIELTLKSDRADDPCQAIVPPAHFNCRCTLAPAVEELPDRPESNIKDFERWLDSD